MNYGLNLSATDPTDPAIWQIAFALQCLPGVIFLGLIWFQPESPRWNVEHGKFDQSVKDISKLYNVSHEEAEGIANEIRDGKCS